MTALLHARRNQGPRTISRLKRLLYIAQTVFMRRYDFLVVYSFALWRTDVGMQTQTHKSKNLLTYALKIIYFLIRMSCIQHSIVKKRNITKASIFV